MALVSTTSSVVSLNRGEAYKFSEIFKSSDRDEISRYFYQVLFSVDPLRAFLSYTVPGMRGANKYFPSAHFLTDGEPIERAWAELNNVSPSVKEMGVMRWDIGLEDLLEEDDDEVPDLVDCDDFVECCGLGCPYAREVRVKAKL
ncbi:hypothetical protein R3P38DRAFT_3181619 [Favolaschia claudopus]|uniref:Uncharacterized protein n=1 Tax=Favolaschia claudopus TaxID=2862362 RepID=A0AAW0CPS4_9AGAR